MNPTTCYCKHRNVNPLKMKFSPFLKNTNRSFKCSCEHSEIEKLKNEMALVKKKLDEAYVTIAEMEFELDSVDLLALQNQWLREELMKLKSEKESVISRQEEEDPATRKNRRSYRQQVSAGVLEPQLESPTQVQRYGLILQQLKSNLIFQGNSLTTSETT
ncbi:uncharacterized protein LOC128263140 [Drosophila gunungcola]|uniref:Uncharacterized protein n=1 Tax=Drosophila gunungcola TaxID=103775 RepID=A0A9Q0BTB0_9MUSC|nr:uncharacterized protein LOC128263140 [Drosophila gunungcola]KAI8043386.1 hypothetical protein M5D96_004716 [Drosophila gunungcola]